MMTYSRLILICFNNKSGTKAQPITCLSCLFLLVVSKCNIMKQNEHKKIINFIKGACKPFVI